MNQKWYEKPDIMVGVGVVGVVAMMIIPIPTFLLDSMLAVSIMIGLIILLTAMFSRKTSEFSVFPTLLLVTTVFRLALNISSTRLILLDGPSFDGKLIRAFGEFVVGGNYFIGVIIFLILVLVQMMVITKGATRIGEVSARFALDALPGKQMSIDSDLSSGLISEEEARKRRKNLEREVDFFGQMDGATKFVQGDVRVGLVITAVNIIGGIAIGVFSRGEDIAEAMGVYTLLTIGDGLVAQIPSLLITTATGLVVTRSGAVDEFSAEMGNQLFSNARVLWMVAGTLIVASLLPGFPKLSLWFVGGLLGFLAYSIPRKEQQAELDKKKTQETEKAKAASAPGNFVEEIQFDTVRLEIGYNLLTLVDASRGGVLVDRITKLRKNLALGMGLIVPSVHIKDNMTDLEPNEYSVLIRGVEVARATVFPDRLAALDSGNVKEKMTGEAYRDPTYKLVGVLIPPDQKKDAESKGYLVIDATNIIITHLTDIIRANATQIMGREEIKLFLNRIQQQFPSLGEEVQNKKIPAGFIQSVLHNLLKEGVPILNLVTILEVLVDHFDSVKDPVRMTELVRLKLSRQIVGQYAQNGSLKAVHLDPQIESLIRENQIYDPHEGRVTTLSPAQYGEIRDALMRAFNEVQASREFPVFIASADVRSFLFMILERETSPRNFAVLAYEELPSDTRIIKVGDVILNEGVRR